MPFYVVATPTTDEGEPITNETETKYTENVVNYVGIPTFSSPEEAADAVREDAVGVILKVTVEIVAETVGGQKVN